ncbi:histone acetylation protein-domain-containing protein [Panaeolus papilionaceus]|nr:histone acetylation protein-domain-containing protein [Panaeolus papilionaceus]
MSSSSSSTAAVQPAAATAALLSTPPQTPPRASFKALPGDTTHVSSSNAAEGSSSTTSSTIVAFNMKAHDPRPKLRDQLLDALKPLPGTRTFHLHVLQTAPRKSNALFPFAKPKPARAYLQDILILCSEQAGLHPPLTSKDPELASQSSKDGDQRVLVTAIEANVYFLAPTSSAVLYISKVDTTGQGAMPSPTTALVRALVGYFLDPFTRPVPADQVWVQLFARAQAQYLFANSADWSGKKPLGDRQLCAWWRKVLGRTAMDVKKSYEERRKVEGGEEMDTRMFYILPGFTELEGGHALRIAGGGNGDDGQGWVYGHPYSEKGVKLPCPGAGEGVKNIGMYIPYFDDDPKSRFLDEIAYMTEADVKSPQKKRQKMDKEQEKREETGAIEKKDEKKAIGELSRVSADEFWERMSFRQECVAGAMTGFFTVIGSCAGRYGRKESGLAPKPGQVSSAINKRVMSNMLTGVEFSTKERAIRSTESLETAIKGLCEGLIPTTTTMTTTTVNGLLAVPEAPSTPRPNRKKVELEVSPNPFPEPETTLETYTDYIYGVALVQNDAPVNHPKRVESKVNEPVRVLTVRKKTKRAVT